MIRVNAVSRKRNGHDAKKTKFPWPSFFDWIRKLFFKTSSYRKFHCKEFLSGGDDNDDDDDDRSDALEGDWTVNEGVSQSIFPYIANIFDLPGSAWSPRELVGGRPVSRGGSTGVIRSEGAQSG